MNIQSINVNLNDFVYFQIQINTNKIINCKLIENNFKKRMFGEPF